MVLHYQPKASLATGEIAGVEALVGWQHPERGLLAAGQFIGLVEQVGLMGELTKTVLRAAIEQSAAWERSGHHIRVAVNLSAANLVDVDLPDTVAGLLERFGLPAQRLQLELTEETLMVDPIRSNDVIARIRALGVEFSLDDFGTGYSSLALLKRLAVDELKIDRSFVGAMLASGEDEIIVRSTIELAHNLGLRTVAEGVEDARTWRRLMELGCDQAQGFHLQRPQAPEKLIAWLDERNASAVSAAPPYVPTPRLRAAR